MSAGTPLPSLDELIRDPEPNELARRLLPIARRFAAQVLGGDDDHRIHSVAEDAVMAACRHARSFRGESAVTTWLFVITRREAYHALRRERRWIEHAVSEVLPRNGAAERHIAPVLARRQALEILERIVPNPAWRDVWLSWNDPDRRPTHEETAGEFGYTPGTVAVILSRVRKAIEKANADIC